MRRLYLVEVTPRPERIQGILQSKTIVYVDGEGWFNPYVDSYDRKGELWKTQIYLFTYRDRPVPDARIAVYPFKRRIQYRGLQHRRAIRRLDHLLPARIGHA